VSAPFLAPLEPHGVGLVRLGLEGGSALLPRGAYAALALGALVALLGLASRRPLSRAGTLVLPLLPLFLAWRSLVSYFALLGPLALVAPYSAGDARRQGAARDPGVPG
jgi:hypothetical protein